MKRSEREARRKALVRLFRDYLFVYAPKHETIRLTKHGANWTFSQSVSGRRFKAKVTLDERDNIITFDVDELT